MPPSLARWKRAATVAAAILAASERGFQPRISASVWLCQAAPRTNQLAVGTVGATSTMWIYAARTELKHLTAEFYKYIAPTALVCQPAPRD